MFKLLSSRILEKNEIGAGAGLRTRELLRDRILSPAPLTKLGCEVDPVVG